MKRWAAKLKRDTLTVWFAARDPRVGLAPKMIAAVTAAYAFSPLDLIPDFIPVLGLLDDLLIVPLGIWIVIKMIKPEVLEKLRARAAMWAEKPSTSTGIVLVLMIWAGIALTAWSLLTV